MRTLKEIISRYMRLITCVLVAFLLVIIVYIQIENEQRQSYEGATGIFRQLEQLLIHNQEELNEIREEYRDTCLHNAEAIAYIIEDDPSVLESVDELKKIAQFMEVDEIHIFDDTGRIFTGTHPKYYDYTFDSGEQMNFFKPMLEDKSLKLVQEITPNTAEAKLMQYSALWSKNGKFIVQVGMEPVNVMKVTQKNELSYLFSLLRVNPEAQYYAIDAESGTIIGSTEPDCVGRNLTEIGLKPDDFPEEQKGFRAVINGRHSFCSFKKIGTNYIGRAVLSRQMYQRVLGSTITLGVCLIIIATILSYAVTRYMNKYVVEGIHDVNRKLHSIAQGNLDELIDIRNSKEFSELSSYINRMKKSLLDNNRKMSYVLRKTNMYIGVYEYNEQMQCVRITEYVPRILALGQEEAVRLAADSSAFRHFIDSLRRHPVPEESNIFAVKDQYVKLEEIQENGEIFGVVIDVTDEIMKRKQIEVERDVDLLTGLYNRRGLEMRLNGLFAEPEALGHSAVIMIDADNLKVINDTYGHEMGDIYLQKVSELITSIEVHGSVTARLGGDEFVLFLYQYESERELTGTIHHLETLQESSTAALGENVSVPLRFSMGYSLAREGVDYQSLLKEADEKMYENKRERKKTASALPM